MGVALSSDLCDKLVSLASIMRILSFLYMMKLYQLLEFDIQLLNISYILTFNCHSITYRIASG